MQLSKFRFFKHLLTKKVKFAGRNNNGRITVRHQGGGHKQNYRLIDLKRTNLKGIVVNFEYDPNRSARIAKVCDLENKNNFFYILAPKGLKIFDIVQTIYDKQKNLYLHVGDSSILANFEVGDLIHNVEIESKNKTVFARAAGTFCQILNHFSSDFAKIRLPSGNQRLLPLNVKATLGIVGNENYNKIVIGKAGRSRWLNKRPSVRGVAMNPVDHPHGGGQGKTKGGRPSVTPWSWPTKGQPTRSKKKRSKNVLFIKNLNKASN